MTFPQYTNKHLEEALFTAHDFIKYKNVDKNQFPSNYIIVYSEKALKSFRRRYSGKYEILKPFVHLNIYKIGDVGFVRLAGIGSPHAGTLLEELIAMGGKRFINLGTAGGLQEEGVFVASKAIRDEGTSHHYQAHGKYAFPDKGLTAKLAKALTERGIEFKEAATWTIDAPYRETKAEIEQYRKEGVATVEMEASALFAIAKLRKVKIASAFVVSDVLGEVWVPKFHKLNVNKELDKMVDASISILGGKA